MLEVSGDFLLVGGLFAVVLSFIACFIYLGISREESVDSKLEGSDVSSIDNQVSYKSPRTDSESSAAVFSQNQSIRSSRKSQRNSEETEVSEKPRDTKTSRSVAIDIPETSQVLTDRSRRHQNSWSEYKTTTPATSHAQHAKYSQPSSFRSMTDTVVEPKRSENPIASAGKDRSSDTSSFSKEHLDAPKRSTTTVTEPAKAPRFSAPSKPLPEMLKQKSTSSACTSASGESCFPDQTTSSLTAMRSEMFDFHGEKAGHTPPRSPIHSL
ncbi:unnamed protein product [Caenorhabditis auriculariae]|uniref:Uncharacterized protein n=1 Tax=Caenorhabditis auriculariae TaxID=2777116 RepID=A0A8S1HEM9_9PELO|nr:unnamed protein product [Caenorhabditis auriculariae]